MTKQKNGINPINFNNLNIVEFYNKYKNLKRFYLFDVLNEFNFLGEHDGSSAITFDSITKLGLFMSNSNSNMNNDLKRINDFLLKLILNSLVGYALPIFKYQNKIYGRKNIIDKNININKLNELELFLLEIKNKKIIIYYFQLIDGNKLHIQYNVLDELIGINEK